ncbi:MAG: restriction endonuclease subunit S, partial [Clostridiales bacterium]|nr:restriction endonuclease subunit S [Clostridiales bacterium]
MQESSVNYKTYLYRKINRYLRTNHSFKDPWEQRKLSDVMRDFIVPMRDKPKEFGGTIPWTRIEDIEGKYINGTKSNQYVSEETVRSMNLKIIPKGSLIVSASATFGVVAQVTQDLITNQTFIGLVPNDDNDLDFWYEYFLSPRARSYMRLQSAGSTIFYIAREKFENMEIFVPSSHEEQRKIGSLLSKLDDTIALHQCKHYQD